MPSLKKVAWLPFFIILLALSPEIGCFALAMLVARIIHRYSVRNLRLVNLTILFSSLIIIAGFSDAEHVVTAAGAAYGIWLFFSRVYYQKEGNNLEKELLLASVPLTIFQFGIIFLNPDYSQPLVEAFQLQMQRQPAWMASWQKEPAMQEQAMAFLEKVADVMPALLTLTFIAAILVAYRFAYPHRRFSLRYFSLQPSFVYVVFAAVALMFTNSLFAWNLAVLAAGWIFIQGLAILFFWGIRQMSPLMMGVFLGFGFLLGIPFLAIVIMIGLLDFWLDFRKIRTRKENSQ